MDGYVCVSEDMSVLVKGLYKWVGQFTIEYRYNKPGGQQVTTKPSYILNTDQQVDDHPFPLCMIYPRTFTKLKSYKITTLLLKKTNDYRIMFHIYLHIVCPSVYII